MPFSKKFVAGNRAGAGVLPGIVVLVSGVVAGLRKNDDTKYMMSALMINDLVMAKNDSTLVGCVVTGAPFSATA